MDEKPRLLVGLLRSMDRIAHDLRQHAAGRG